MHALAACATALPAALLAGCSGRANDLSTYYDDPAAVSSAPPSTSTAAPATSTTPPGPAPAELVAEAALTQADLVEEGVTPVGAPASSLAIALPDCAINLGAGADAGLTAQWRYARGSVLRQYVVHTPEQSGVTAAVEAARDALDCRSFTVSGTRFLIDDGFTLDEVDGADRQLSWCAGANTRVSCTVVLASGDLLTAVSVESTTTKAARDAITRVAPVAATALGRARA
ncbi:RAD23 family protein [Actinokineospora bangkokensis]|uniref:hypothetical protein n=1 Tax=Actinokineospora bangkokensis TaxID=1193682 RepID=UPI00096AE374|nr:hypothetical protein [Actinokineospora bangkokensis]